jgi:integrase/recombinase XerD
MPNEELIAKFLEYFETEKGCSSSTIEAYGRDIKQFAQYLGDRVLVATAQSDVGAYQEQLLSKLIDRSVARKMAALRAFFKFLLLDGLIREDPSLHVQPPKISKVLPRHLTVSEVENVLNAPSGPHAYASYLTRRDQCILEMLYAAGLRVSELRNLCLIDVRLTDRHITVRLGKGQKDRETPFGLRAVESLKHYLALRHLLTKKETASPWLFVGRNGRQLTRQRIWQIVHRRSQAIGRNVSPHMFRHSCATHMVENGADLRTVQTILGHVEISTTQLYTHLDLNHLRKSLKEHHPRETRQTDQLSLGMDTPTPETLLSGIVICAHCMRPVCKESRWYCDEHLRLNREANRRSRAKKKRAAATTRKTIRTISARTDRLRA